MAGYGTDRSGWLARQTGRRNVLRAGALGAAGLAAAGFVGCGSNSSKSSSNSSASKPGSGAAGTPSSKKYINQALLSLNDPKEPLPYVLPEEDLPPKSGGIFRMSTEYDIASFDPTNASSNTSIAVTCSVCQSLLGLKHGPTAHPVTGEIIPRLAKSWEIAPDGLTVTFHLNDGIKFQNLAPVNGRALTAEDIKQVYGRYQSSGISKAFFSNVTQMTSVDPTTFQVKLAAPQPDFLSPLSTRILPIYAMELVDSGDLKNASKTIGTGPYMVKEAIRGDHITYVRNPDYWGSNKGYLDGAEWKIQTDTAARAAALRVNQCDFADNPFSTFVESLAFLKQYPNLKAEEPMPINGNVGFALNLKNPKFQDDRLRQGLALVFDRKGYVETVNGGHGTYFLPLIPWNYLFDTLPTSPDQIGPYRHLDMAEGKKLLAAAGADKLTLDAINYYNKDEAVGYYVSALRNAGITLNNRNLDLVSFSAQYQTNSYTELAGGTLTGANFYADAYFKDMVKTGSPGNKWNMSDPDIDKWADQQSVEQDPQKRKVILKQIWDRIEQKAYRPLDLPQVTMPALPYYPYVMGWRPNRASGAITPAADCGTYLEDMWFNK